MPEERTDSMTQEESTLRWLATSNDDREWIGRDEVAAIKWAVAEIKRLRGELASERSKYRPSPPSVPPSERWIRVGSRTDGGR
jgi:hypothetical protein